MIIRDACYAAAVAGCRPVFTGDVDATMLFNHGSFVSKAGRQMINKAAAHIVQDERAYPLLRI